MKYFTSALMIALLSVFSGCASGPEKPSDLLTQVTANIGQAKDAGAEEFAPVAFRDANKHMNKAKDAIEDKEYLDARRLLEKSLADADFALAKTNAEKAQNAANQIQQNLESLKTKTY